MFCEYCGKQPATTHVKRTVNGQTTELHLCAHCAAQHGFGSTLGLDFGDFWGSLFSDPGKKSAEDTVRCEDCGRSFREIAELGKTGCPTCYRTFYTRLLPSIRRIHGKTQHTGKVAQKADDGIKKERELQNLREQLEQCVAAQEYEKCAELRDKIQQLEQNGGETA